MRNIQLLLLSAIFGGTASILLEKIDQRIRRVLLSRQAPPALSAEERDNFPEIELYWPVRRKEIHRESEVG